MTTKPVTVTRRRKGKHTHVAVSEWLTYYNRGRQVGIRKELTVGLLHQYQHHYPPGDHAHGCCTSERFAVVVQGHIVTPRDAKRVAEVIAKLHAEGLPKK